MHSPLCPVAATQTYLGVRSNQPDPIFILPEETMPSASDVRSMLSRVGASLDLPSCVLTSHAFLIGAVTTAMGIPNEVIARMEHWSSKAYLSSIRCSINRL